MKQLYYELKLLLKKENIIIFILTWFFIITISSLNFDFSEKQKSLTLFTMGGVASIGQLDIMGLVRFVIPVMVYMSVCLSAFWKATNQNFNIIIHRYGSYSKWWKTKAKAVFFSGILYALIGISINMIISYLHINIIDFNLKLIFIYTSFLIFSTVLTMYISLICNQTLTFVLWLVLFVFSAILANGSNQFHLFYFGAYGMYEQVGSANKFLIVFLIELLFLGSSFGTGGTLLKWQKNI